ncbi:MAG: hypothetical protein ACRDOK_08130 [Streptosporangiaceae bacterium]
MASPPSRLARCSPDATRAGAGSLIERTASGVNHAVPAVTRGQILHGCEYATMAGVRRWTAELATREGPGEGAR